MLTVSPQEFSTNFINYLDKIDNGLELQMQRSKNKVCKVVHVFEDDTLMSKEEYFAMIERGIQNIKEGKGKKYSLEELRIRMGL